MAIANGSSIEAVLTLNASGFDKGLTTSLEAVDKFKTAFSKSITPLANDVTRLESSLNLLGSTLSTASEQVNKFSANSKNLSQFNTYAQAVNRLANALKILSSDTITVESSMNIINNMFKYFQDVLNGTEVKITGVTGKFTQLKNSLDNTNRGFVQYELGATNVKQATDMMDQSVRRSINDITQYTSATSRATSVTQQQAVASDKATVSANKQATATRGLGKALSSLRMVGSMVASMMVYNFAHNLITATRETVNAKSEMEGYFKMLHFSQSEVDGFNKKLDETVQQFQRVNKYSLGETISSIGVEFNLSTKEMEQAMKVTSMITSEYLRAGRNANEASLAVKDVLQGQFQRLSRETGVKGEQLKDAGWSGDTNDVLGLMKALEKVAESRNWDVFAEKANSLNDIVTILQNRFGEWSAEMVNIVQPSIVGAFNAIMSVGGAVAGVLGGLWEWINGDGIANQAVKWTGLATAIGGVVTALVHYRTGANLAQLVQMGLRGSIMATILGLKAEEVATYGTRNAIVAKLTSIKAEQVATMGVRNAILTKVLGLKAEMVANNGLKGAIMSSVGAKKLEEATTRGATVAEKAMIVAKHEEDVANMSTLKTIFARIAGVNMETYAERGLIVALAQRIAQSPLYIGALEAEEVAELSTAEAGMLLLGTLTPLIAILAGLAVAIYSVVKPLQDASEQMKSFNSLVNDGDDIIKTHKKSYDSYSASVSKAQSKLEGLEEGSNKYLRTQNKLTVLQKDQATAYENWQNSIKAVEMARSRQGKYEEKQTRIAIRGQTYLKDAYIQAGLSAKEASEMASPELQQAIDGAEQLRKALQMIRLETKKGTKKNIKMINMLDQYGLDEKTIKEYGKNMTLAQEKIVEGMDKFMTSDDLMERVGGWFEIQQGRFEQWWTELNAFFEVRDWDSIGQKIQEGLKYIFTGFGAFNWIDPLKESIGEKGIVGTLMDWLWGEGDSDGVLDIAWDALNSWILEPVASWLNWFFEDPIAHFNQTEEDLSLALAKALFGNKTTDSVRDMVAEWADKTILQPILDWFQNLPQHIAEAIGSYAFDWAKILGEGLWGNSDENIMKDVTFDEFKSKITDSFNSIADWLPDAVIGTFTNIDLLGMIMDALLPQGVSASDGSSDHPSFMEDLSAIIGTDIQTWIENFNADPLGTLGIQLPQIDIMGMIQGLFSTGGGEGSGLDIGSWLKGFLDISGLVSQFILDLSSIIPNVSSTVSSVGSMFNGMRDTIRSHLSTVVSNVSTGFESVKTNAVSKITSMKDSVKGVIDQMTQAWTHMKDSILNSAKLIYDGVKKKFDDVGNTLKDFFGKLQNPSQWGAGHPRMSRSPRPATARKLFGGFTGAGGSSRKSGAGISPYTKPNQKVRLGDLIDVVGTNKEVTLSDFLSMFSEGGFGGWSFHEPYKTHIFNKGKQWKSGSPTIKGIGTIDSHYQVERFWDGSPKFSWNEFLSVAEAIFSQIPYRFYYDSEWKGSWVGALLSGALNCSDGAEALIALASVFGFGGGTKVHTTTKDGIGHFYANINGHNLDTTNFQNNRSWSPLGGAGVPTRSSGTPMGKTVNVNVEISGTVYGVDDLDSKIQESVQKGLQQEFNDPYTVAI